MKSKFMAGLVASLICLVFVVAAAILITEALESRTGDRFIKVVAFATIGIWLGLYSWFKPKAPAANQNQTNPNGEVKQEIKPREAKNDRTNIR